jgi:hypothetical protein
MTPNIYFHNGGLYAMLHYIGAVTELSSKKQKKFIYWGNSAGASWCVGCYLVLNGHATIENLQTGIYNVFEKKRQLSHIITPICCELIDVMVPYWPHDLAKRISGILNIGVTTKNGHKWINKFNTNNELYNALLCSGTISGCSNHVSMIDNEVCLDGGYMFNLEKIPPNTRIIASDIRPLVSLTIPPPFMYSYLKNNGERNVKYGLEKPLVIHKSGPLFMKLMFLLHEMMEKDPACIRNKTI